MRLLQGGVSGRWGCANCTFPGAAGLHFAAWFNTFGGPGDFAALGRAGHGGEERNTGGWAFVCGLKFGKGNVSACWFLKGGPHRLLSPYGPHDSTSPGRPSADADAVTRWSGGTLLLPKAMSLALSPLGFLRPRSAVTGGLDLFSIFWWIR